MTYKENWLYIRFHLNTRGGWCWEIYGSDYKVVELSPVTYETEGEVRLAGNARLAELGDKTNE